MTDLVEKATATTNPAMKDGDPAKGMADPTGKVAATMDPTEKDATATDPVMAATKKGVGGGAGPVE